MSLHALIVIHVSCVGKKALRDVFITNLFSLYLYFALKFRIIRAILFNLANCRRHTSKSIELVILANDCRAT